MATTNTAKDPEQIPGIKFNVENMIKNKLLENKVNIFVNAFPIKFNKDINVHKYPFTIVPETNEEYIISNIFRKLYIEIFKIYGNFYRSGNNFYSVKEVSEPKDFSITIVDKGQIEYTIRVDKKAETSIIKKNQTLNFSQIHENIIFMIIREILTTNPNVKVDKDNFYLENNPQKIEGTGQSYYIHDGYKLSLKQTEVGLCLIVGIKNRVKGDLNVYDALMYEESNYGYDIEERIENLIGKRFVPEGSSKSKQIYDISQDKTPSNTSINYGKETYTNYIKFFKDVLKKDIKYPDQPMILVKTKGPENKVKFSHYVPEFCILNGINQYDIEDFNFMRELAEYTKLEPDDKIKQIYKCLDLFKDKTERKQKDDKKEEKNENKINEIKENDIYNTSDKKREFYGIEIDASKLKNLFSYHLKQPTFNNVKNKNLNLNKNNEVGRLNLDPEKWICLYNKSLENSTYDLLDCINYCKKDLGIKITSKDSNWKGMESDKTKDWEQIVEQEIKKHPVKFVIFFISKKNNHLYNDLKKFSLSDKGYVSQVIKYENYIKAKNKRRDASYISKILLQINCKLGGANYFLNLDKNIFERNIIFVGINFGLNASHTWERGEKGAITMVATKDKYFSKFCTFNEIIDCKDKNYILVIQEIISNFIDNLILKYKKEEGCTPKNIIFYRQGISQYAIDAIKSEIKIIEEICNSKNINYYYTIVNMKTSLKLFEFNTRKTNYEKGNYKNPEPGLVVLDKVTDTNKFEFYLQPQKVTQGSATPTYFHVIYGNMNYPELLMQLTYWTTYIYPNWQSAVRIPHVLKLCEKFSYMTAKITRKKNNEKLSDLLAGL